MSFRKVYETPVNQGKQAKVVRDVEWDQFIAFVGVVNEYGKVIWNMASQYHTDDRADAINTANEMIGL